MSPFGGLPPIRAKFGDFCKNAQNAPCFARSHSQMNKDIIDYLKARQIPWKWPFWTFYAALLIWGFSPVRIRRFYALPFTPAFIPFTPAFIPCTKIFIKVLGGIKKMRTFAPEFIDNVDDSINTKYFCGGAVFS